MLKFKKNHYTIEEVTLCGETVRFRAFRDLVYVEKPVNVEFQKMNLFVPESYYEGPSITGYDLVSAPVFMPNTVAAICRVRRTSRERIRFYRENRIRFSVPYSTAMS